MLLILRINLKTNNCTIIFSQWAGYADESLLARDAMFSSEVYLLLIPYLESQGES